MKKIITTLAVASIFGVASIASAQTTGSTSADVMQTTSVTDTSSSTVGVPNTGAGGDAAANFTILATSAAVAIAAGVYAFRRPQAR